MKAKTKISTHKKFFASIVFVLIALISCKKDLQENPSSYFTSANFFKDVNEADMATLGVYEIMSNLETYGWYVSMLYDNDTDVSQISGVVLTPEWREIPHYNGTTETSYFYSTWSLYYTGIDRANVVIESVPKMDLYTNGTASEKAVLNQFIGEAKFLRGFYYSELVRLWGDVPFKIASSKAGDDFDIVQTDRYVIYEQIFKDLKDAADLLPQTLSANERVNKWTAKAMLAKIALFAGGYSLRQSGEMERPTNYREYYILAKQQLDDIMASNPYHLNPDYAQVFKNQCQHVFEPTENIFEVAFYNPSGQKGNSSYVGVFNAPSTAKGVYAQTSARCLAPRTFYESFAANDLRRDFAIVRYKITADGTKSPLTSGRQDEQWTAGKWSREYQKNELIENGYTGINWVIMRYSDLLLIRAEVENELSDAVPNDAAYNAINMVRRRAYGKPINTPDPTVDLPLNINKDDFLERIKVERSWELCFEGGRRADLIRWNMIGEKVRDTQTKLKAIRSNYAYVAGTYFIDGKHELYPIPLNEKDVNKKIGQNPLY